MLDRTKPFVENFGPIRSRGKAYRQGDKSFNAQGYEVDENGKTIERMPVDENDGLQVEERKVNEKAARETADEGLMMIDRIKIESPESEGYLTDDDIRAELDKCGRNYHRLTGRPKLLIMLKEELGINE